MKINATLNFKGYLDVPGYQYGTKVRTSFNTDDICERDIKQVSGGTVISDGRRRIFIPSDVSSTEDIRNSYLIAKHSDTTVKFNNPDYPQWNRYKY